MIVSGSKPDPLRMNAQEVLRPNDPEESSEILLTSASAKMWEVEQFMTKEGDVWLCTSYGKSSDRKHVVVRHLRTIHAPSERIVCDVCKEVYKNIETFKYHLRHTCRNNREKLDKVGGDVAGPGSRIVNLSDL